MYDCVEIFSQRKKIMKSWNTNFKWRLEDNELGNDPKML